MPNLRTFQRSFGGGEVTPEFFGRIDDAKYQTGVAKMRNFISLPHGPAANRPGFGFVREVKNSAVATRVIPFTFSTEQTFTIELGAGYFRFHTQGATLLSGTPPAYNAGTSYTVGDMVSLLGVNYYCIFQSTGNPPSSATYWYELPSNGVYEIPNPYAAADLFDIHFVQSADVLTLVHPKHAPRELRRLGATRWTLTTINFTPSVSAPTGLTVTPSTGYQVNIQSISKANPGVLTTKSNHGLVEGDSVYVADVGGMTELANGFYIVNSAPSASSLTLKTQSGGEPVDTTSFSTYTSGGYVQFAVSTVEVTNSYKVTAIGSNGLDQSVASAPASAVNNLFVSGAYNTITWSPVAGAVRYNIYKQSSGLYGYIGQTEGTSFTDDNITADLGISPPNIETVFNLPNKYPGAVSYYEQRRCFAGTIEDPQKIWMTRSGTESDMSFSLPVKDDDRISFRVAAREANTIRHIAPLTNLILLTSSAEWRVTSINTDALTPTSINVKPQSYIGANNVQPVIVNTNLIYAANRGGHVRELGYSDQQAGYITGDLSLRAPHLFDNLNIVDMAYAKAPQPICWFVSSNGKLLGLTYVPEQSVGAWHQHDTDGKFESICCVAEGNEDVLYAVIQRTIDGNTVRYVERLASRQFETLTNAFFVDSGLTYSGPAVASISGLEHLEGKTLNILINGAVHPQRVVVDGAVDLQIPLVDDDDLPYNIVAHLGLPVEADLQTLPLTMNIDGFGQGRFKNVNKAWLRVYRSSGIFIGPNENKLTEAKQRSTESYGAPPSLKSEELEVMLTPTWADSGQVYVRQYDPLPLTLVSLTLEVAVGG
jgi:Ubiquitin-activating enzyme E1 FCCH domain